MSTEVTQPVEEAAEAGNVSHPTSSWDGQKVELPGTPTPERPPSTSSSASEDTCSICLGHVTDRCVADSCLHSFCLLCLKEWAKQKAVCPLCKSSFKKIMFNIRSETEFEEWIVPVPDPMDHIPGTGNFQEFLNAETRRFFGYRTTNFPGAVALRRSYNSSYSQSIPDAIPSLPPRRRPTRFEDRSSQLFRLNLYMTNTWVLPLPDITGRYRQCSPQLYRDQPALTHRLFPWVNRELTALLPPAKVRRTITKIMQLIERYPINSTPFNVALRPFMENRTNHFLHEFYHFARSPYDMIGHDNAAQYVPRYYFDRIIDTVNNTNDDSDAVIEVDSTGAPIASTSAAEGSRDASGPGVAREETLTHEGSVVISSSESTDDEEEEGFHFQTESTYHQTHNPEPPRSKRKRFIANNMNVNKGASTSGGSAKMFRKSTVESNSDSDVCMIVDEVVTKVSTPEVIEIDSHDEEESPDRDALSTATSERPRGKTKPKLHRHNFLAVRDSKEDLNVSQDHSYCTEDCPPTASRADTTVPNESTPSLEYSASHDYSSSQVNVHDDESDPSFSEEEEEETRKVARHMLGFSDPLPRQKLPPKKKWRFAHMGKIKKSLCESSAECDMVSSAESFSSKDRKVFIKSPKDLKSKIKKSGNLLTSRHHSESYSVPGHSGRSHAKVRSMKSSESSESARLPPSKRTKDSGSSCYKHYDSDTSSEGGSVEHRKSHLPDYRSSSKSKRKQEKRKKSKHSHRDRRKRRKKEHKRKHSKGERKSGKSQDSDAHKSKSHDSKSYRKKLENKRRRRGDSSSDSDSSVRGRRSECNELTRRVNVIEDSSICGESPEVNP